MDYSTVSDFASTQLTDQDCQDRLLPGVSRTFALTIPQLPEPLCTVVTNAYLLCRIADTIEDDSQLSPEKKAYFHKQFRSVITSQTSVTTFTEELYSQLAVDTPLAEKELIKNIPIVIRCLRSFDTKQQESLQRAVNIMSKGMPDFQQQASLDGLENITDLNRYCYFVAGVVGEMLTELFCDFSPQIAIHRKKLMELSASFGQGLQMTNILKDYWEDRQRGVCWFPREVFTQFGLDIPIGMVDNYSAAFTQGIRCLVNLACDHLKKALEYTLLIPPQQTGIRRFCLWAIGLALLTLRNIYHHPNFTSGAEVKISRRSVKIAILISNISCRNNLLLKYLFRWLVRGLT